MPTVMGVELVSTVGTPFLVNTGSWAPATIRVLTAEARGAAQACGRAQNALGSAVEPTPRHEEPVATGSSLTSCPYLATYKGGGYLPTHNRGVQSNARATLTPCPAQ